MKTVASCSLAHGLGRMQLVCACLSPQVVLGRQDNRYFFQGNEEIKDKFRVALLKQTTKYKSNENIFLKRLQ